LKDDIDDFVGGGELEGIVPLEIFSYFTCLPFDVEEADQCREYLATIRNACIERGHKRMAIIVDETLPILGNVSGTY
jgi:hypothetical protein